MTLVYSAPQVCGFFSNGGEGELFDTVNGGSVLSFLNYPFIRSNALLQYYVVSHWLYGANYVMGMNIKI